MLSAFQAGEDNMAAVRILAHEASELRVAVASSQHLLDLAHTRCRLGIDSYLNVITAPTASLSNQQADVQIRVDRMLASVALVRTLGGGWDMTQLPAIATASLARFP